MSIVSDVEQKVSDFVLHKAIGRAVVVVAQAAASFALAHSGILAQAGISVSIDPNIVSAALLGGLHVVAQMLAAKFPKLCGWIAAL